MLAVIHCKMLLLFKSYLPKIGQITLQYSNNTFTDINVFCVVETSIFLILQPYYYTVNKICLILAT